jgi:hypothetical protein
MEIEVVVEAFLVGTVGAPGIPAALICTTGEKAPGPTMLTALTAN